MSDKPNPPQNPLANSMVSTATAADSDQSKALQVTQHEGQELAREFYRPEGYTPEESVGYMMRRILSLVGHSIEREMEPNGLTNAQWLPLFKLYRGTASTVAELARECDLDAGSMTRMLDRLEAKQLCQRVRSSNDRRVVNIELTEAGMLAAQEIPKSLCRVQNDHLVGFSDDEFQQFKGYLRRVLNRAQVLSNVRCETPDKSDKPAKADKD
jgi:DNA-binding MarR family transcriptional regulator